MTAEREGLAEVLHEALYAHRTLANSPGDAVCACDRTWRPTADYRAHLADALADLLAARDRRVRAEAVESVAQAIEVIAPAAPHTITPKTAGAQATRSALLLAARTARAEADA